MQERYSVNTKDNVKLQQMSALRCCGVIFATTGMLCYDTYLAVQGSGLSKVGDSQSPSTSDSFPVICFNLKSL